MEEALKDYGYNVTTLPIIIGQSGSQYHTTSDALAKIGVEHGPASKVMSKLHEHYVLTFHKILISRKGEDRQTGTQQAGSEFYFPLGLWPMVIAPGCRLGRLPL